MTTTTQTTKLNGVNVDELCKTIDTVKTAPEVAKFKFRLRNQWKDGGHNRSMVNGF